MAFIMALIGSQLVTRISVEGDDEAAKKVRGYGQVVDESRSKSDRAGLSIGKMFSTALSFPGGQMIFTGLGFLKDQLRGVFQESMDAQAGLPDTVNVLKTTLDGSRNTAQHTLDLAHNYSHLTHFTPNTAHPTHNI